MTPANRTQVLVVEDDERLAWTLRAALRERFGEARCVDTVAGAREAIGESRPDLLILDFKLPDGNALDLLRSIAAEPPSPPVVAISAMAGPRDTFELAALGVRAFLEKPLDLDELERAVDEALHDPPDITGHLRQTVGHVPLREVEAEVRRVMVDEAMGRSKGSRRAAARILSVSRQLLQHILRGKKNRRS